MFTPIAANTMAKLSSSPSYTSMEYYYKSKEILILIFPGAIEFEHASSTSRSLGSKIVFESPDSKWRLFNLIKDEAHVDDKKYTKVC